MMAVVIENLKKRIIFTCSLWQNSFLPTVHVQLKKSAVLVCGSSFKNVQFAPVRAYGYQLVK